ncbi:MAG: flagellar hook-basal body complex protein [Oscillospiraceae bacterium]|nr:flagellar hook-basal body complex protein [Oscillospiraceae bacterium]
MVRSLYSGVAGLKTQQTKMDVIGNNIANVGTYGYKAGRATFKDVYYQTNANAAGATGNTGGTNPIQIGYGDSVGSIDINTATAAMSATGYSLDVAIGGEGYFQVMDPNGEIFYTKAGMLDIDAEGNLVDINGNFILGSSGESTQDPASNRIQITLPFLDAATGTTSDTINGVEYRIDASNLTTKSNVNITFVSSSALPIGQQASAEISSSSIVVTLNANEQFASIDDLNVAVNEAITAANGGIEHPGGTFTITMDNPDAFAEGITGAEIVSSDFGYNSGTVGIPEEFKSLFSLVSVNDGFSGDTEEANMQLQLDENNNLKITIGEYTATVNETQLGTAGTVVLRKEGATDKTDSFVISYPSLTSLQSRIFTTGVTEYTSDTPVTMTPSEPTKSLGLGSTPFRLQGGTEGGEQTVANLTSIGINDDGVITGLHEVYGIVELGRIDIATFSNPAGLAQVGNTYFEVTLNSGDPIVVHPGDEGSGSLVASTLESSNVDLSSEFSDMIMTQRGFQASSRVITVSDTMLEELINLKR